ncbi:MAG: hypothetical protein IRZ33_09010 [Alicyclobacillaceae bacterium]|nr:hypothetical protein [Alicyclobacillaceae bacterium]
MIHEDLINLSVVAVLSAHKRYGGVVRKVGTDFLLIDDPAAGAALIALEHVKQLRLGERTPPTSPPQIDAASVPVHPASLPDTLRDALCTWTKSVVQLDGAGPEPVAAYLLDVRTDYLAVSVIPEGLLYVPTRHVQLVRPLDVTVQAEFTSWMDRYLVRFAQADRFAEALSYEAGIAVKIGRGGPDEVLGVVRSANDHFVELVVSPHELVRIPMHHVKSVSRLQPAHFDAAEVANDASYAVRNPGVPGSCTGI